MQQVTIQMSVYLCMRRSKILAPSGMAARIRNWDPGINDTEVHGEAVLKTNAASGLPLCHTRTLKSRLEDSRSAPWSSKAQLSRYDPWPEHNVSTMVIRVSKS